MNRSTESGDFVQRGNERRANDRQEGGNHYQQLNPQPWDVVQAWNLDFFTGNALTYIARWQRKGGPEDLRKAIHYLEKRLEIYEGAVSKAGSR